jgi:hypothetical protein
MQQSNERHRKAYAAIITLLALVALGSSNPAAAAKEDAPASGTQRPTPVVLQSRVLPEPVGREQAVRPLLEIARSGRRHVLVRMSRLPSSGEREALAAAGIRLVQPISSQAWFAEVRGGLEENHAALRDVDAAWSIQPDDRLAPRLKQETPNAQALDDQGNIRLRVLAFPGIDLDSLATAVSTLGGQVDGISKPFETLSVRLPQASLRSLAQIDGVHWIEPSPQSGRPELNFLLPDLGADTVHQAPYGLSGSGVSVAVLENGHAVEHLDLSGRLTHGDSSQGPRMDSNHATMVAGLLAGDGTRSGGLLVGLAPGASVLTYAFGEPSQPSWDTNRDADVAAALQAGADVANNSWGYSGCNGLAYGDYTSEARLYDLQVLGRGAAGNSIGQPTVVVFSGGNERWGYTDPDTLQWMTDCIGQSVFPYRNYHTINQPKPAKNIIVVGAVESDNPQYMTEYSSWGPVSDGRLRPDLVAGGQHQGTHATHGWSALVDCNATPTGQCTYGRDPWPLDDPYRQFYRAPGDPSEVGAFDDYGWFGFTSAAAAQVSGAAALLIENYRSDHPGSNPPPSLVKAHLIHSARDLDLSFSTDNGTRPGPDYATGYGFLDIDAAIDQYRTGGWSTGCLDQGESETIVLPIPDQTLQAKMTLVWDDVPASPAATGPALVNDLDLVVFDSSGTRHYPWTLDPANPSRDAWRNSEDHLNNVEMVLAEGFVPGPMTIEVRATDVPAGPQCYSLVYAPTTYTDFDGDGWDATVDCDDTDPEVSPGAPEGCSDNRDNDCDGQIDEPECVMLFGLIDLGDGTVIDYSTCLMWLEDSTTGGSAAWAEAATWVRDLDFAGHDDWRLPSGANPDGSICNSQPFGANCTQTEMGSLYFGRGITAGSPGPFTIGSGSYWTATRLSGTDDAMAQDMTDGGQNPYDVTWNLPVWAVRSVDAFFCEPAPGQVLRDDADLDGFTEVDDCNDERFDVNPAHDEVCFDAVDNDCDGNVDEFCGCGTGLVDLNDGTVLETSTCLMWKKNADWNSGYWSSMTQAVADLQFAGFDDWRLPTTAVPDATCSNPDDATGSGCSGSELGHLYYVTLGNLTGDASCTGPFTNYGGTGPTPNEYWSQTLSSGSGPYTFGALSGYQIVYVGSSPEYCQLLPDQCYRRAWPMRDHATADRYPGNTETCDGIDNDCDGIIDDLPTTCGVGACAATGFCSAGGDSCVPGSPAPEACDGIDNDCNGIVDDGLDADGDGYLVCAGDCDDTQGSVHPEAQEICDGLDNDCNGLTDEGFDADADGFSSCNDCDDLDPGIGTCNTPPSGGPMTFSEGDVSVTLPNVTSPGDTIITVENCDQTQLDGVSLNCPNAVCADIETTAAFDGEAEVCVTYVASGCADACSGRVVACEGSPDTCRLLPPGPNDDPCDGTACGLTTHFSYFAVGLPTDGDDDGTPDLADNCPAVINIFQLDDDHDGHGNACDCDPADPVSFPGGVEFCDGTDNDCNGTIDDACGNACTSPSAMSSDAAVSDDGAVSAAAAVAWSGLGYGVAWHDERAGNYEIYFSRRDAFGGATGQERRITVDDGVSAYPSLVWTGSEYGLAWRDDRDGNQEIYFLRLDAEGNRIGNPRRITNASGASGWPSLVWDGRDYGLAWYDERDGNREIYFTRLHRSGNKIRPDVRITADPAESSLPALAWTGKEWGVAWHDQRNGDSEIYFARLEAEGDKLGDDMRVTNATGTSENAALVSTGTTFGVVWHDLRDEVWEIYFARLDAMGNKIDFDRRLTQDPAISGWPDVEWSGSEFGVFWHDQRDGTWEIYQTVVDAHGLQVAGEQRLTLEGSGSYQPAVVWDGDAYALAWHDNRDGNLEIYFNRFSCCADTDGDTVGVCDNDCNDSDATVYPGAPEICDYQDNNCDGVSDEGYMTPGSTYGLRIAAGKATILWDSATQAERYDVIMGDLSDLSSGDFSNAACLESNSVDTQAQHAVDPAIDQGFYYLVRAEKSCRRGTYDTDVYSGDADGSPE